MSLKKPLWSALLLECVVLVSVAVAAPVTNDSRRVTVL